MKIFAYLSLIVLQAFAVDYNIHTDSFTDSQGQTAKYRIGVPTTYTPGNPVKILIHLHGNNSGTQDDMLNMWYPTTENRAENINLIPIVVASPGTRSDGVTRQWDEQKDPQMLDELIESNFGNRIQVDHQGVYLWGASQGTCFINSFLLAKADDYGGGALGNCGCFNYLSNDFDPGQDFKDNYRFYILATTGDFLHEPSTTGYEFYRWTAGLKNIRGDLERPGNHCTAPYSAVDSALSWIVGDIDIPETPNVEHWQRISTADSIRALSVGSYNKLIAGVDNGSDAIIITSEDQGDTWDTLVTIAGESLRSIVGGNHGEVLVLTDAQFYRYSEEGLLEASENVQFQDFIVDGDGNIFRIGSSGTEVSIDSGVSWVNTGIGTVTKPTKGHNFIDQQSSSIVVKQSHLNFTSTNVSGDEFDITLPSQNLNFWSFSQHNDKILLYGWDYTDNWKPYAWTTTDRGANWTPVTLPASFTLGYTGYGITFYHDGSLLYHGSGQGMLSNDNGATWVAEKNLGGLDSPIMTLDQDGIAYVSSGVGIFRKETWTNSAERPQHTHGNTPVSIASQVNPQDISYRQIGTILILEAHQETHVRSIQINGQTQSLYQANPQGKHILSLEKLPRGSIIQIQSGAQSYQLKY